MLALGAFLYPTGYHVAAWRHPDAVPDAGVNFDHYRRLATLAEAACFDFLFLPDSSAFQGDRLDVLSRSAIQYVAQFEPFTLGAALAAVTSRIGIVLTASTTYNEPYTVARTFASLDHLSGGRGGWNLVTSQNPQEAGNFGLVQHPSHAARYARAQEFADVVTGLWESWDHDAFPRDRGAGRYFDPERMHRLDHRGEHFRVRGPLNVPRSPQGRPVLVQAGSSPAGRDLAARCADLVFTAQSDVESALAFRADLRARACAHGRPPGEPLVLVGIFPFVGGSEREAHHKAQQLEELVDPTVGLYLLGRQLGGIDLSGHPLDGPLPELPPTDNAQSRRQLLVDEARRDALTIRQLCLRVAAGRGHLQLRGTPETVADLLEGWYRRGAADGFFVMPPVLPGGLEDIVEGVVPELVRRGLFRRRYEATTLRGHLGLPVPADRNGRRGPPPASSDPAARSAVPAAP